MTADDPHCTGCGRPEAECAGGEHPCGRGRSGDQPRFCPRCGWRLREIAVVPGLGGRWCRTHGLVATPN